MNRRFAIICMALSVSVVLFGGMDTHAQEGETHEGEPATSESAQETEDHGSSADSSVHGKGKSGHGGGHTKESGGWSSYWKPAVTQLIALFLLIGVYIQWVHPILKEQHRARNDRIQSDYKSIEQDKKSLRKQEKEIEEKMEKIEEKAEAERQEILERGRQLKQETIEEAEQRAEEAVQAAQKEADRIRERAKLEIQNTMTESALNALRSYFKEEAGEQLHEHFQENLLDAMKEMDSIDQFQHGDDDHLQEST